jgi:translation initiation factor eIF-2B subunit epsilon
MEIIEDHPALKFHTDLLDCHIDICSPELLLQFSDNFDYLDIRRHFIQNEVLNWELGMHIYGYILKNEYAARVHDPRTYHSISHDIINRWVYPLVPDTHLVHHKSYSHLQRFQYKAERCLVSRHASLGAGVVVGSDSVIDRDVHIHSTVVGSNCRVLAGASITESHIWDGMYVMCFTSYSETID